MTTTRSTSTTGTEFSRISLGKLREIAESISIPYPYLTDEQKNCLWKSPETIVGPKVQDILRSQRSTGSCPFLAAVSHTRELIQATIGLGSVHDFISAYLGVVQRKARSQRRLSRLVAKSFPHEHDTELRLLLRKALFTEAEFFALSAETKSLAEKAIQTVERLTGWTEDDILKGATTGYSIVSEAVRNAGGQNDNSILCKYFNKEPTLRDFLEPRLLRMGSKRIPVVEDDCVTGNLLVERARLLTELDNVFDKILEIKRPFMHDLLAAYSLIEPLEGRLREDLLEEAVELLLGWSPQTAVRPQFLAQDFSVPFSRSETVGVKALSLEALAALGYPVPDFEVLGAAEIKDALSRNDKEFAKRFAHWIGQSVKPIVRSAHIDEDSRVGSRAGYYLSLVTAGTLESLREGIQAVASSAVRTGTTAAVIVQRFVDGCISGVAFAQSKDVLIEYVDGTNEALASGTVTPRRILHSYGDIESLGIMPRALRTAATMAERIRQAFHYDADIEFTWKANEIWILQVRPITARVDSAPAMAEIRINGNTVGFGSIVSPGQFERLPLFRFPDDLDKIRSTPCCIYSTGLSPELVYEIGQIRGVLTEEGGSLAHLALVCREYGIAAIVGIPALADSFDSQFDGKLLELRSRQREPECISGLPQLRK